MVVTIIWFAGKKVNFDGTDIDPEAVQWCRENIKFANFAINGTIINQTAGLNFGQVLYYDIRYFY